MRVSTDQQRVNFTLSGNLNEKSPSRILSHLARPERFANLELFGGIGTLIAHRRLGGSYFREDEMIACCGRECAYCRASIAPGQRWVRERIYDPLLGVREPGYCHYHAEPFAP